MGTPDNAIYGKLCNTVAVSTYVSTRIYPGIIPPKAALPAICYDQISDPREHAMVGDPNIGSPRYQVDVYSTSWSQCRNIATRVKNALQDYQGTTWCTVQRVFYEGTVMMTEIDPETKLITRRASQDYVIWWST